MHLAQTRGLLATQIEIAQTTGEFGGTSHALRRVAVRRRADVLAEQVVADVGFPTRGHRLAQVAGKQLIEQHAQRIHIALHGRRMSGDHFGRQI